MFASLSNAAKTGRKGLSMFVCSAVVLLLLGIPGASMAEMQPSPQKMDHTKPYLITVDPADAKVVGPELTKQIHDFFDYADNAIKTKDMRALSSLYSERYADGLHKKSDVMVVWKRLFDDFDSLTMTHNLRFMNAETNKDIIIVQCSGILMGTLKGDKNLQALDHWMNMSHVLVKEDKGWKIIGTSGSEQKRFWFDKPLHPLF